MPSYATSDESADVESPADDSVDDSSESEREDTFFVPPALIPGADTLKPGDKLTFTMVGRDADGHLEVEYSKPAKPRDEEKDLGDEMRSAVKEPNAALIQEENA